MEEEEGAVKNKHTVSSGAHTITNGVNLLLLLSRHHHHHHHTLTIQQRPTLQNRPRLAGGALTPGCNNAGFELSERRTCGSGLLQPL